MVNKNCFTYFLDHILSLLPVKKDSGYHFSSISSILDSAIHGLLLQLNFSCELSMNQERLCKITVRQLRYKHLGQQHLRPGWLYHFSGKDKEKFIVKDNAIRSIEIFTDRCICTERILTSSMFIAIESI